MAGAKGSAQEALSSGTERETWRSWVDGASIGSERVRSRKVWGTKREKRSRVMSGQKDGEADGESVKENAPATVRKRIPSAEMKVFKTWKGNKK